MKNRISEQATIKLFEEFYIKALANETQLTEFFDVRIKELDGQVREVTDKLKELAGKVNAEQSDIYKLNDAFKDLGVEINNISLSLKSLVNSSRNSLLTKQEAQLINENLQGDYEVKIKESERKLIKALLVNFMKNLEQKIGEEDKALLKKRFYPLIEIIRTDIIDEELNQRGQFRTLLEQATEQYAEVNNKVMFLSDIIDKMRGYEEEVLSEQKLKEYVGEMKKEVEEYNAVLYGKITRELDSLTETNFSSIEAIQRQYQQIIDILNGQISEIDREGTVKAFKPLIRELIDVELGERGRFVELLSKSIDKLSKEKDEEIQNTFRQIVTTIVGEGTKQNQRMARQNTEIGLRKMSESDIDELLGRKILNIVDRGSSIGRTLSTLSEKVNNIAVFGGGVQKNIAQKFFDGLSFYIYYYKFTKDSTIRIVGDNLLADDLKNASLDYIGEFEKISIEFEQKISEVSRNNPEKYKQYKKVQVRQITDNETMQTLDVHCFFRYFDEQKVYFFLNQEPSMFFKKELDNILSSGKTVEETAKNLKELIKNYSIPKVQVAVFNKEGFELPYEDDDNSVVSTKTGDKGLTLKEEDELSDVLDKIENYYPKKTTNKLLPWAKTKHVEYCDNLGLWYFWSINNPSEKYLAVKMVESFEDSQSEEDFKKHVKERIWFGLQKSKSIGEMQDWVDSFTQKDSGVLNSDGILIKTFKFFSKNWLVLVSASILALFLQSLFFWWVIEPQNKSQNKHIYNNQDNIKTQNENAINLFTKLDENHRILLESQANTNALLAQTKTQSIDLLWNFGDLLQNVKQPFKFEKNKKSIDSDSFSQMEELEKLPDYYHIATDYQRIKNVGETITKIHEDYGLIIKIKIIPHINRDEGDDTKNVIRAKNLEAFFIEQFNMKENWIHVEENEFILTPQLYGFSIKLLQIDPELE